MTANDHQGSDQGSERPRCTSFEDIDLTRVEKFFGREVVRYYKYHQGQGRMYNAIADGLGMVQVSFDVFDNDGFPDYDSV